MTDNYRAALVILYCLLKDYGPDFWAEWIDEDIRLWDTEKSVEHHLSAYDRGEYSLNSLVLDCLGNEGIWEYDIFQQAQNLAYSLAKGEKLTDILENTPSIIHRISGWNCRKCRKTQLNSNNIEYYVSRFFVPKFFLEYLKQEKLQDLLYVRRYINADEVQQKRENIKKLILNSNILFSEDANWFYTCPNCQSKDVCMKSWEVGEDKLIEVEGNV